VAEPSTTSPARYIIFNNALGELLTTQVFDSYQEACDAVEGLEDQIVVRVAELDTICGKPVNNADPEKE
jgi:hypothetical protein